jgi:hypothetical protein
MKESAQLSIKYSISWMKIWQCQKMDEEPNVLVSYVNAALFMNKETVGGKIKLH